MDTLRKLRKAKQKTQQQMASMLGISQQAYATYENNKAQPPLDMLIALSSYFSVSIDYLLGRTETPGFSQNQSIDITPAEERYLTQAEDDLVETFREIGKQKGAEVQNLAQRLLNQLLEQ